MSSKMSDVDLGLVTICHWGLNSKDVLALGPPQGFETHSSSTSPKDSKSLIVLRPKIWKEIRMNVHVLIDYVVFNSSNSLKECDCSIYLIVLILK